MWARAGFAVVVVSVLVAACGSDGAEWELVDTLGQRYRYSCDSEHCDVTLNGGDCADGSITGSAILQACPKMGRAIFTLDCRPVVCTNDGGCRTSFDVRYSCIHGLCQRDDAPTTLDITDLQLLCIADTPRAPACAWTLPDASRLELATAACPGDDPYRVCPTVPAACRSL